jgi:uncharacterized membrane protein YkgB
MGLERSILFPWRWPDKRAEPFVLSLIFFVSFLYQDKKERMQTKTEEQKKNRQEDPAGFYV